MVAYRCVGGDGEIYIERANALTWGPGMNECDYGRIVEYAVISETVDAAPPPAVAEHR